MNSSMIARSVVVPSAWNSRKMDVKPGISLPWLSESGRGKTAWAEILCLERLLRRDPRGRCTRLYGSARLCMTGRLWRRICRIQGLKYFIGRIGSDRKATLLCPEKPLDVGMPLSSGAFSPHVRSILRAEWEASLPPPGFAHCLGFWTQ